MLHKNSYGWFSKKHSSNEEILNAKHVCEIEEEEEEEKGEEEKDLCQPCRLNEQEKNYRSYEVLLQISNDLCQKYNC